MCRGAQRAASGPSVGRRGGPKPLALCHVIPRRPHLWKSRGFRVLTRVRVLSQGGDGAFQVGIVAAFFFDPNAATTPAGIAAGFAIMFAPFTLVGPFVGP